MNKMLAALIALSAVVGAAVGQDAPNRVLFTNVNIFDGTSETLQTGMNVLVENNLISQISGSSISAGGATVIDGGGRTLMPGLIDLHTHLNANGDQGVKDVEANFTWEDLAVRSVAMADLYLKEGFTTIRDMGGMGAGLQRQIDAGFARGPRIYPSGAWLGPPGGHSDFRNYTMPQTPGMTQVERLNIAVNVSGADAMTAAARQNFMQGASQIKLIQTGGVASLFDPWQMQGLNADEIAAAVQVAESYGSYVGAHSYSKDAIMLALELGVKTIEHGFMFDGEVAALMEEKGAYLTTQMTAFSPLLGQVGALQDPKTMRKLNSAQAAFGDYVEMINTHNPKFGYMTDCVGSPATCKNQIAYEKYLHADFFGNHHMLVAATSTAGEIVAMSGEFMNPYPEGKLGVIEVGAYADILLVDGNPLQDLTVIGAVDKWFDAPPRDGVETIRVIMKDGVIYKNTLERQ